MQIIRAVEGTACVCGYIENCNIARAVTQPLYNRVSEPNYVLICWVSLTVKFVKSSQGYHKLQGSTGTRLAISLSRLALFHFTPTIIILCSLLTWHNYQQNKVSNISHCPLPPNFSLLQGPLPLQVYIYQLASWAHLNFYFQRWIEKTFSSKRLEQKVIHLILVWEQGKLYECSTLLFICVYMLHYICSEISSRINRTWVGVVMIWPQR